MKPLSKIARAEDILTEEAMKDLIVPVKELPTASAEQLGKAYLLSESQPGYKVTNTYICEQVGEEEYVWKQINVTEAGQLAPVKDLWASSIIDGNHAVVTLHWEDPVDTDDAHWKYSVVVKKRGAVPQSVYDGVIVGYSGVRNQYLNAAGFVDAVDSASVDDSDIIDDTTHDKSKVMYYYNVFAVTKFGISSDPSPGCPPVMSWQQFQRIIQAGKASDVVKLGDVIEINCGPQFGNIEFVVADFSTRRYTEEGDPDRPTVTLMADKVLFRGSFDHKDNIAGSTIIHPERNGCNRWLGSNIQEWLNGTGNDWHVSGDAYSKNFTDDGTYGAGPGTANQFSGFYGNLPEELRAVMLKVNVKTTRPVWATYPPVIESEPMFVFLPSYEELFGTEASAGADRPSDVIFSNDHSIYNCEGTQFGIFKNNIVKSRMKLVLETYNTTKSEDYYDNMASWFTRTPSRAPMATGESNIDGVYMVTCKGRDPHETTRELGADGAALTTPYVAASQRDMRTLEAGHNNNIAPGFVPCIVIG